MNKALYEEIIKAYKDSMFLGVSFLCPFRNRLIEILNEYSAIKWMPITEGLPTKSGEYYIYCGEDHTHGIHKTVYFDIETSKFTDTENNTILFWAELYKQ